MANLIDTLESNGVTVRRSGKPDEVWLCCPFCVERQESPDTRFRLGVNIETGYAHCFNCGWSTRSPDYLQRALDEALQTGAFELGGTGEPKKVIVRLPEDFDRISTNSKHRDYFDDRAYAYLKKRKVTDNQIKKHKMGVSMNGTMQGRIVIPIYVDGKLMGLVGRDFTGKSETPYKNSVGERSIFNLPIVKAKTGVLTEGPFDALAVERSAWNGEYDGLAVLGHSLTQKQLKQLKGYKEIILWPDYPTDEKPEDPGMNGFLGMVSDLQVLVTKTIRIVMPNMKGGRNWDPDEYPSVDCHQKIVESKGYSPELEQRLRAWAAFRRDE